MPFNVVIMESPFGGSKLLLQDVFSVFLFIGMILACGQMSPDSRIGNFLTSIKDLSTQKAPLPLQILVIGFFYPLLLVLFARFAYAHLRAARKPHHLTSNDSAFDKTFDCVHRGAKVFCSVLASPLTHLIAMLSGLAYLESCLPIASNHGTIHWSNHEVAGYKHFPAAITIGSMSALCIAAELILLVLSLRIVTGYIATVSGRTVVGYSPKEIFFGKSVSCKCQAPHALPVATVEKSVVEKGKSLFVLVYYMDTY